MTTRWSVVVGAGDETGSRGVDALETLCRAYWFALYAYIWREGRSPEDDQDLTQECFSRLLVRGDLAVARSEKGWFRSYRLGVLKHFLADEWDKSRAAKRGGGETLFSLDAENPEARYALELSGGEPSGREFGRRWAAGLPYLNWQLERIRAGVSIHHGCSQLADCSQECSSTKTATSLRKSVMTLIARVFGDFVKKITNSTCLLFRVWLVSQPSSRGGGLNLLCGLTPSLVTTPKSRVK